MNGNYGGDPDYVFSELRPVRASRRVQLPTHEHFAGEVTSFATQFSDRDFGQARQLWKIICAEEGGEAQFLRNILPTLTDLPDGLKKDVLSTFS
jgi:catalase